MADDKDDRPLGSQTIGAADGKDVLYGWLVGRAAADLGLAQAIAASEAQRAEQIKRLEHTLLGQMRELRNHHTASSESTADGDELDCLKLQVQQFGERQNFVEAQQLTFGAVEGQLSAKLKELEAQIEQRPAAVANFEVSALRGEVSQLEQRLARAEASATRESISIDRRQLEEQIGLVLREQTEGLKTQLFEQFQKQNLGGSERKILETSFQQKFDAMQQEMREKSALLRLRDGELRDLRAELAGVAQRLDQVAANVSPQASINEREAERAQWQRDCDDRLTTRLRELGDEIRGKLNGITNAKVDQQQFRGETLALTARIAKLEEFQVSHSGAAAEAREAHQTAMALRGEIAELKTAVLEQLKLQPNDALRPDAESVLRARIEDLHVQIGQSQRATLEWKNHFNELRGDVKMLKQRQVQSESEAKQGYALASQEMGQIRGGLERDLMALEAQLNERLSRDGSLQSLEESLSLRLQELHNQLTRGTLALEERDGEIRELKDQVRLLGQRIVQSDHPNSNRFESIAAGSAQTLSTSTPRFEPAELYPIGSDRSTDNLPNLFQPGATGNGHPPEQAKISPIDLHDRLSAEIERKRAELREKSGRWKLRQ